MQNAQAFNQMASDKRWVNMMGALKGLGRELNTLAPHPNRPGHKGPLFVKIQPAAAGNDDGAALANMLIGAFMGAHFGGALGNGLPANLGNALTVYDAYHSDRAGKNTGGLNGDIELGKGDAICGGFNLTARYASEQSGKAMAWDAYLRDLPNRRILEQNIGRLNRQADRLEREYMTLQRKMAFQM